MIIFTTLFLVLALESQLLIEGNDPSNRVEVRSPEISLHQHTNNSTFNF
jgi:hypothetical protein